MKPLPDKFDSEFWLGIFKLLGRLAVLAAAVLSGSGGLEEFTATELAGQEAKAGQLSLKADAYPDYYELVRYHAEADARCDQALEMFARHRDDDHDWEHVLEACDSTTPAHVHEGDTP